MKNFKMLAAVASLFAATTAIPAHAATVVKNLTITSSIGFVDFSVNFDNSASFVNSSSNVSLISTNLYTPLKIAYNADFDFLSLVGGNASFTSGGACDNTARSFCAFISNISTSPASSFLLAIDGENNQSFATNIRISEMDSPVAPVPEPTTWAMMLAGFGMIGFAARRRMNAVVQVTYA